MGKIIISFYDIKTTPSSGFFMLKKELLCSHELGQLYKELSIVSKN
jgi:hypothetical protein